MQAALISLARAGLLQLVLAATLVALAGAQGTAPLRKTDLVRLLGGRTLSSADIARLVRRNCLSFTPSDRDRRDFVALGADAAVLASLDGCVRRRAARSSAAAQVAVPATAAPDSVRPVVGLPPADPTPSSQPPAPLQPPVTVGREAAPAEPAPAAVEGGGRLLLLAGGGQRGRAGTVVEPVVVQVVSQTGAPMPGVWVAFTATNARASADSARSDSAGVARIAVVLGTEAGPATVTARAGTPEVVIPLTVIHGPPVEMVMEVAGQRVRSIEETGKGVTRLVITARDSLGNRTPLSTVRFASASERVARIASVEMGIDSAVVTLELRGAGSTEIRFAADPLSLSLPVRVSLPSGRRAVGVRASYVLFDYHWKLRPKLRSHPGQTLEAFASQRAFGGLTLGFGGTLGAFQADTAPSPAVTTLLIEAFVRADYTVLPRSGLSPVLSLMGGGYRMQSDAKGELVFHTYVFWGAGLGLDVGLGSVLTGEIRVARHSMLDYVGEVATLAPIGVGLRFRF